MPDATDNFFATLSEKLESLVDSTVRLILSYLRVVGLVTFGIFIPPLHTVDSLTKPDPTSKRYMSPLLALTLSLFLLGLLPVSTGATVFDFFHHVSQVVTAEFSLGASIAAILPNLLSLLLLTRIVSDGIAWCARSDAVPFRNALRYICAGQIGALFLVITVMGILAAIHAHGRVPDWVMQASLAAVRPLVYSVLILPIISACFVVQRSNVLETASRRPFSVLLGVLYAVVIPCVALFVVTKTNETLALLVTPPRPAAATLPAATTSQPVAPGTSP